MGFQSSSFRQFPGVLPGDGFCAGLILSVLLKWISHLFSLRLDVCDREVLEFENSVHFGQNDYSRSVSNAFQLAHRLQCKRSLEKLFSPNIHIVDIAAEHQKFCSTNLLLLHLLANRALRISVLLLALLYGWKLLPPWK